MIDLTTQIANINFTSCIMNAAGVCCSTTDELSELNNSSAGSLVTKSATIEARQGNPSPRYVNVPLGSINSMGLPNLGFDYYLNFALSHQAEQPNKKIFFQ